jgi:chromodomain-helicase-DNA-binding protein 7
LWSLLNFIEPAKFPDAEKFAQRFGNIQTQEQVENLQRRIAPHLLRRVKEDVAKDIPPKEETIIDVELTTMQKQYYR